MSDHGGKRQGAGRKPGSIGRKTREIALRAAETGMLPHEFLLAVCRGETIGDHTPTFEQRLEAARAAAPYFAPRLSQIDATVKQPGIHEMSEAELDRRIAFALAGEKEAASSAAKPH